MKLRLVFFMLWFVMIASAQAGQADDFLSQMPKIPDACCGLSSVDKDAYIARVDGLLNKVSEELAAKSEAHQEVVENQANQMAEKQLAASGMTMEQAQALSNASKEEQQAFAEKLVAKKLGGYGLDMETVKQMENMSEAEQEAMAQKIAQQMQQNTAANPAAMSQNTAAGDKAMRMAQIQEKLEALQARLKALYMELGNRIQKVESMADTFQKTRIAPILDAYTGLDLPDGAHQGNPEDIKKATELDRKLNAERLAYCKKFTPQYIDILNWDKKMMSERFKIAREMDKGSSEMEELRSGVPVSSSPEDMVCLQEVKEHAALYLKLFQFDMRSDSDKGLTQ